MTKTELQFDTTICDIISNTIINEHQKINPEVKSKIWVTWADRFFVVNGFTNLTNVFDISLIVNEKLSDMYSDWTPINLVDLIRYGTTDKDIYNYIPSYTFQKKDTLLLTNYDPVGAFDKRPFKKPTTSSEFYGLSITLKKEHLLAAKIANHIYHANYTNGNITIIISRTDISLFFDEEPVTSPEFIENVVDTCFADNIENEYRKMDLVNYDFIDVIHETRDYPWLVRDHMKDFMMI